MTRLRQIVRFLESPEATPLPPTISIDGTDVVALIDACKLLLAQYEALDDYTLGGALTNAPFIKIKEALGK